jgi:hypothetical protein
MDVHQLLARLDKAWADLRDAYSGLDDASMLTPGVIEGWSVKDVLAHVTTWEEEALKYLPLIIAGGRPPRYATYGGIDAFNAETTARGDARAPRCAGRGAATGADRARDPRPPSPAPRYLQPLSGARKRHPGVATPSDKVIIWT